MEQSQYYFLVSGLPELQLGDERAVYPYAEYLDDLADWVTNEDAAHIRMVRLPFDNYNAITLLTGTMRPFDKRGNFTRTMLEAELKSPADAPGYLYEFATALRENRPIVANRSWEDQLNELYYTYIEESGTVYWRAYSDFDRHLRNGLAARNLKLQTADRTETDARRSVVIGDDDVTETIIKSSAPDFSLSSYYTWADAVLAAPHTDLAAFELQIDRLRWEMAEELIATDTFGVAALQAFGVRLGIAHRWAQLDKTQGKSKLTSHIERLLHSNSVIAAH